MKLILIRHGRSLANEEKQNQEVEGVWRDTSLHELGILQARKVAERLKEEKIGSFYSSPLKRAKETAEIINYFHDQKIFYDERLEEHNKSKETIEEFIQRCKNFFEEVTRKNETCFVIAHGGTILTLMGISTGNRKKGGELVRKHMQDIGNTSVTIIEKKENGFEVSLIGCKKHRE